VPELETDPNPRVAWGQTLLSGRDKEMAGPALPKNLPGVCVARGQRLTSQH
jgi:hypothetical protein